MLTYGDYVEPRTFKDYYNQILALGGLPRFTFHALRHSCATILLYLGYSMKDIQTWPDHSNFSFTANTYVHSSKASHMQMAQSFSEHLPSLHGGLIEPIIFEPNFTENYASQTLVLENC